MPVATKQQTTDADQLGVAFVSLRQGLAGYLRKQVGDAVLAEDLLQDVFVKALLAIRANKAPHNLPAWLYTVARTTVIDHYRAARPETQPWEADEEQAEAALLANDNGQGYDNLADCLTPLIDLLPPIYRDTLKASDFAGTPLKVLAADQDLSLSAIKSRVSRARAMLKEQLLVCCQVELSANGVGDYDCDASANCAGACDQRVNTRAT